MAVLWSAATLLCGLAQNYEQMLAARVLVGVGEAAYGSVGIAVIISVFPKHLRATLTGAFMAGGLAGQVLGVGIGGARRRGPRLAHGLHRHRRCAAWSWRAAYPLVRAGIAPGRRKAPRNGARSRWRACARCSPAGSLKCAYVGSGLQLFVAGALPAWLPTYFVRYYDLPLAKAASLAAVFLALGGAGMIVCGMVSDRLVRAAGQRALLSTAYCLGCAVLTGGGVEPRRRERRSWCCSAAPCSLPRPRPGRPGRWSRT